MNQLFFLSVFTLSLAQTALAIRPGGGRSHECASFTATLCALPNSGISQLACSSCAFDASRIFYCPLVAAGYYSYETGQSEGGGCANTFLAQSHHLPQVCGARCCRTEHKGAFEEEDPLEIEEESTLHPHVRNNSAVIGGNFAPLPRFAFQPTDSTCRYKEISRGQVMRFFATHNSSLLVIGDSTMRQLYLRMIAMMRGQQRILDLHIHSHLQYQVCREVDFLRLASNNPSGDAGKHNEQFLKGQIPAFFKMELGNGLNDAKRVLSECSHSPLEFNFLQAPLFKGQIEVLSRYISGLAPSHKPTIVLSVGYFQAGDMVPFEYLKALRELKEVALRIVYVGVPVSRVFDPDTKEELSARNEHIRRWVHRQGAPFSYVDFDEMVGASGAPRGTPGSKLFSCWAEWLNPKFPSSAQGNAAGTAQMAGQLKEIHTDVEGTCVDEMNRNLWQVLLNSLLDGSGTQALID